MARAHLVGRVPIETVDPERQSQRRSYPFVAGLSGCRLYLPLKSPAKKTGLIHCFLVPGRSTRFLPASWVSALFCFRLFLLLLLTALTFAWLFFSLNGTVKVGRGKWNCLFISFTVNGNVWDDLRVYFRIKETLYLSFMKWLL